MDIKVLLENTTIDERLTNEHGLSLYITNPSGQLNKNILFDFGQTEAFALNAKVMGIDLAEVDVGVLSHGHYDHGGGLRTFLATNEKAKVYANEHAFSEFYGMNEVPQDADGDYQNMEMKYIGLDKGLGHHSRIIRTGKHYDLDRNAWLLSDIRENHAKPSGNKRLVVKDKTKFSPDEFNHEQNLVIDTGQNVVLFAGCAHKGIRNIMESVEEEFDLTITHIISGLHLRHKGSGTYEDSEVIGGLGNYLLEKEIRLYTGHCTGNKAYKHLKTIMGNALHYLHTGMTIHID